MEPENRIKQLEAEVAELKAQLASATGPKREKIQTMSSEVKDTNPYSRLMGPWITKSLDRGNYRNLKKSDTKSKKVVIQIKKSSKTNGNC